MIKSLQIIQIIIAVLLSISILLQSKGAGLSGVFGGGGNVFSTKRGAEKKLFTATIILSVLFFAMSLVSLVI
ncbi:MAG: preprotein translocase subunit SecG [bacterium]